MQHNADTFEATLDPVSDIVWPEIPTTDPNADDLPDVPTTDLPETEASQPEAVAEGGGETTPPPSSDLPDVPTSTPGADDLPDAPTHTPATLRDTEAVIAGMEALADGSLEPSAITGDSIDALQAPAG